MNIYASSYQLCSQPHRLRDLFGDSTNVAVIGNALDFSLDLARRAESLALELDRLSDLGLKPAEVDLREFFNSETASRNALGHFDGVWVVGGNAFILRRAMRYSRFDELIWEKEREHEAFVYAGYSAGACVLAPSLKGIDLVDPPDQVPEGYESELIWEGLGLLPYSIAPHFDSDHPESSQINDVVEYFGQHGIPYQALRDGEAIVVRP